MVFFFSEVKKKRKNQEAASHRFVSLFSQLSLAVKSILRRSSL